MEYDKFINKPVGVVTTGRVCNILSNQSNVSFVLEGILEKENDTQIYLKNLKGNLDGTGCQKGDLESSLCAISKDKIVALYIDTKKLENKLIS